MAPDDLESLINARPDDFEEFLRRALPEDEQLDYKRDLSGDFAKTIAAMANSQGGTIVFGVDEDKVTKRPKAGNGFVSRDPLGAVANHIRDLLDPRVKVRANVIPALSGRIYLVLAVDGSYGEIVLHRDHGVLVRHLDQSVAPNRTSLDFLIRRTSGSRPQTRAARPALTKAREHIHAIYDRLDYAHVKRTEGQDWLGSWPALGSALRGFPPSSTMLVAGLPGAWKTSFALNVAVHAALDEQAKVLYVTTRESALQMTTRALALRTNIASSSFVDGQLQELDYALLAPAMNDFADARLDFLAGEPAADELADAIGTQDQPDLLIVDGLDRYGDLANPLATSERLRAYHALVGSGRMRVLVTADEARSAQGASLGRPASPHSLIRHSDLAVRLEVSQSTAHDDALWRFVEATTLKGGRNAADRIPLAFHRETGRMAPVATTT